MNRAKRPPQTEDARVARGAQTRSRILTATRAVLARQGQDLTLDHVAARLGLTKQAVLYHFPSKDRLLVELALLGVAEEAEAMIAAVAPARTAAEAVRRFLRASLGFHLADLERFRLIYVRAQVVRGAKDTLPSAERKARIYPFTSRMYEALEEKLRDDAGFPKHLEPRTLAVAIHLAAIGYATMAGELQGAKDAMKLPFERYADELATAISGGFDRAQRRY
ncbi:MAG TPA: helix-turn-helix domain-containing protein [Polyangia bacterium]|jgi:AcrR family transcriptional regulator|nr:helix-turn-helix domain-containing protein [Polyangia bacterium]